MRNSLVSTSISAAAFLAVALCGTPLLAQQPAVVESPNSPSPASVAGLQAAATPGVRIVRLSQVNGEVQLDRQTGNGFEAAFPNLPIVQGGRLRTGNGVAEVEFEDNSSLRLTPNSLVEFPVLSASHDGTRASTVHVAGGAIYVSLTKSKDSTVTVTFGNESLVLSPSAHIELALNGTQPRLDVMDGTVQAVNGATTTTVGHKKALLFDPANAAAPTLVSKNEPGPYDAWDKKEVEYHNRLVPSGSNYASTPYTYGLADMNYYGSFASMGGGCGLMWRPYLVSAMWSPYSNGAWAYYPTAGYSWVSPYPWGWTAFHSGSWNLCNGSWGWQPNNQWNGLQNVAAVNRPGAPTQLKPPAKPIPSGPTVVAVSDKPLVVSGKLNNKDSFVFRNDSAGLGVPRDTFGKLDHISNNVAQHGSAERPVYVASSPSAMQNQQHGASTAVGHGATASHTMPTSSRPTANSPSSASSGGRMSGGQAVSTGPIGGGGTPMGAGGAGGGHSSAGGHH